MTEGGVIVSTKHEVLVVVVRDWSLGVQDLSGYLDSLYLGQNRFQVADHHPEVPF